MEKHKIIKTVVISFISLFAAVLVFGAIVYYNEQNKYEFKGQSSQGEISLRDLRGIMLLYILAIHTALMYALLLLKLFQKLLKV